MKLTINKKLFLASWGLAERSTSVSGSVSILSSIFMKADFNSVQLQATDIKTSIICGALGVTVLEPGSAVFPVKMVSDLFKKAPGEEFTLNVSEGRVILKAGKSKFNFSSYPINEFPKLPDSKDAAVFCTVTAADLARALEEGTLAASTGEEYPLYLSSACLEVGDNILKVLSTDTRRLAISSVAVKEGSEKNSALLPMKGIKELQRIIASLNPEEEVQVLSDTAQFYFKTEGLEFTVRRVESKFPAYSRILPQGSTLRTAVDRGALIAALERADVVVRDFNRMIVMDIEEGKGILLRAKAPDFGQAKEEVEASSEGEKLRIAVNSKFFLEALKVIRDPEVTLSFNGAAGHMAIRRSGSDDFLCLIAPINLTEEELKLAGSEPDLQDGD